MMSQDVLRAEVVVLDLGTPELTLLAARSALASIGVDVHLNLIDNGCAHDHSEQFRRALGGTSVSVRRNASNIGFAAGMNQVLRAVKSDRTDAVVLLNSDVVLEPDTLLELITQLSADGVAAVAPAVWIGPPDRPLLEGLGDRIDWLRGRPTVRFRKADRAAAASLTAFDAEWLSGACLVIKPEALSSVGLLDERYFAYFEETDWCVRASRLGWRLRNCPSANVQHLGAASSACTEKLHWMLRNNLLFMRKLARPRYLPLFYAYWWLIQVPNLSRWCIRAAPRATVSSIWRAVRWNLDHRVERVPAPSTARLTVRSGRTAASRLRTTPRRPRV